VAGESLALDAALGIALYPADAREGGQLVERAELALHRSQRSFGRKWHFHDDAMQDRALRRAVVSEQLDGALLDGAFSFATEPIFAAPQGRACATEALIRWRLADGSLLRASEFIPAVESSGRIVTLGEWALPAACRQFVASRDYAPDLSLVLNVSDAELAGPTFLGLIDRSLANSDLSPRQVRLDVAARRGLAERPNLLRRLFDLRDRGIQLAFDGFTGREASLHQIQDLPFHQIKLHQDVVETALGSSADRGRFHAMVGYCRALGMAVAVKGVETERHLELVLEAGCDEMQGRLLTPPSLGADSWDSSGTRFAGRL
jgi:EAL domain-containing protein (putative c-di-GMP-specific phosphodiesterase class I)